MGKPFCRLAPGGFACFALALVLPLLANGAVKHDELVIRERKSDASIRVVTANIRHPKKEDDRAGFGWKQRKETCVRVLLAQKADIICCQEARLPQIEDVLSAMPGFVYFGIGNREPVIPSNPILYSTARFEKLDGGGFWLSKTPHVKGSKDWGSSGPRYANWVKLKDRKNGKVFVIWNTHFDYLSREARENGAKVAVRLGAELFGDMPQIFCGDFNSSADSKAMAILRNGGWIDTFAEINGGRDPGLTAHQFRGAAFAAEPEGAVRKKIDFVLRRGALRTLASEVIRDSIGGRYPSDHYFVSAEMEFIESQTQ